MSWESSLFCNGSRKESQPNQLKKAAVQCGPRSLIPHLQESSVARPPPPPRVCSWWIMLLQFGNRPHAPSCIAASAWILLVSHLLLLLQLQGLLMPMLPRLFVFVPGWRQAEAFLLSSFICFSGVKSSCHLAAPQQTYMIFLLAKGESCQNVKEKVLQRCC